MKLSRMQIALVTTLFLGAPTAFAWDDCLGVEPTCNYPQKATCISFQSGETAWACIDAHDSNNANLFADSYSQGLNAGTSAPSAFSSFSNGLLKGLDDEARAENRRLQNELLRRRLNRK